MELNVGMYVKTKYNTIRKIVKDLGNDGVYKNMRHFEVDKFVADHKLTYILYEEDVIKARYNPIELIEVGDFVNGLKVIEVREHLHGDIEIVLTNGEFRWSFSKNESDYEIKTIATKEQFEQIQYRIGD